MKLHGWILQNKDTGNFVMPSLLESKVLRLATVYPTRKQARNGLKVSNDIPRKVSLTRKGKAIKIISGR